ncbi:MAG: tyrosine-type recombinase/integrase [Archangium sp.]|nr:tyrosine-type recombinase/integrase [Archangium sp.]
MKRWDGLVEKYVSELRTRQLAESTISMRERELLQFGSWLKRRKPKPTLETIEADHIIRYVESRGAFHSRSLVASVMSMLKSMGEFLVREGAWRKSPLRWMSGPPKMHLHRPLPRRIDQSSQQALWRAAEELRGEHARHQAICVLAVLYGTGLRRGELERLDVDDWDVSARILRIDGKKTGKQRAVAVGEGVARCIEAYLPHRHNRLEATGRAQERSLLVSKHGLRMTGQMVSLLVGRLSKRAGIERVTLHQFRHSCASDLLAAGVTIPEVQRVLGHAVIQSTIRYAAVADPQRAEAMALHPLNRFLGPPPEERKAS